MSSRPCTAACSSGATSAATIPAAVAGLPKDMIAVPWNYWDTQRLRQDD